jgi:hypothetical protein
METVEGRSNRSRHAVCAAAAVVGTAVDAPFAVGEWRDFVAAVAFAAAAAFVVAAFVAEDTVAAVVVAVAAAASWSVHSCAGQESLEAL